MSDTRFAPTVWSNLCQREAKLEIVAPRDVTSEARVATLMVDTQGQFYIEGYRHYIFRIATSCLTQPEEGDRVRFVEDLGNIVVIDVLYCADTTRGLTLSSHHHQLTIRADELNLEGQHTLALSTQHLSLVSRSCRWVSESLRQIAQVFQLRCDYAERVVMQADTVQARHIIQEAQQSYRVNSKLATINADAVLKMDGSQIHMG